jgi:transposase
MKRGPRVVVGYSSTHEKALPYGSIRRRMELHRAPPARPHRIGTDQDPQPTRDPQPSAGVVDSQSVKSTAVGGEQRGYDGGKKVKGRKRHILVDTEGFVLKAKIHSAKVMDYEGINSLLQRANEQFPRLRHLWLDAGYKGEDKGADWVQKTLGWTVDLVERPKRPAPERVLMAWAREWAKEGVAVDWWRLLPPKASWYCRGGG